MAQEPYVRLQPPVHHVVAAGTLDQGLQDVDAPIFGSHVHGAGLRDLRAVSEEGGESQAVAGTRGHKGSHLDLGGTSVIELLSMQGLHERIFQVAEIEIGGLGPGGNKEPQNVQTTAVQGGEQSV